MTLWIAWTILVSALVALATLAAERISAAYGIARRGVWIVAIVASTVGSAAMAFRTKAASRGSSESARVSPKTPSEVSTPGGPFATDADRDERSLNAMAFVTRADQWVGVVWTAMTLASFLALGVGIARLHRRRKSWGESLTEAGTVFTARDDGPAVVGFLDPRIVMPEWALRSDDPTRSLMLRHEFEHLRAGDSRLLFGSAVLSALFPWNPALRFMTRRLRLALEIDCDARVVRSTGGARAYGHMLLSVGDRHATPLPASALLFQSGAQLEARIDAMTTPLPKRPMVTAAVCASIAGLVLATAAWTPRPSPFRTAPTAAPEPKPIAGNPPPRYPNELRATGEEGVVVVSFITDKFGVPDTTSIIVVQATNEAFASSVRTVLPRWHYSGAGAVQMAVRFNLTAPNQPRAATYVRPSFAAGVDTLNSVVVTGVRRNQ